MHNAQYLDDSTGGKCLVELVCILEAGREVTDLYKVSPRHCTMHNAQYTIHNAVSLKGAKLDRF